VEQVDRDIRDLRGEMGDMRGELNGRIDGLNASLSARIDGLNASLSARIDDLNQTILRIGGAMIGVMTIGFLSVIAAVLTTA
jgi:hypothetical protein